MKFREIYRFELTQQLQRSWPWAILATLIFLSYLMTRDGMMAEALLDDFLINSPFAVLKTTVVGSMGWLLMAAVVGGEAGARDLSAGIAPLRWSLPVSKLAHLGGRFLAALTVNLGLLLGVQLGILLGIYVPGVDPEIIGPFRVAAFLTAYLYISVPLAIAATALQFAAATRSGRPMSGYGASLGLMFFGFFVTGIVMLRFEWGRILDPIGVWFVLDELSHSWTTAEKSWRLLELRGTVLVNRLAWVATGMTALGLTYRRFRFDHTFEDEAGGFFRRLIRKVSGRGVDRVAVEGLPEPSASEWLVGATPVPDRRRDFGGRFHLSRTVAIAGDSFRALASSWAGRALLVLVPPMTVIVLLDQMYSLGSPLIPTTGQVLQELTAPLSAGLSRWLIVPLVTILFAGELVWRERDEGVDEITDTMPGSDWAPFAGKLLGVLLILALFMGLQVAAGIATQTILGHHDYQLGLYGAVMFGLQFPEYALFAVLALSLHAIVNRKYLGHLVGILSYVFIVLSSMFGVHHDMLIYGAGPWWTYTDMRGLSPYVGPILWFRLYWAGWAVLLAVAARLSWPRGLEGAIGERIAAARRRLTPATGAVAAAGILLVASVGGFVFYNTNVLNEYVSPDELERRRAAYELRYGDFAESLQPDLERASLRIEVFPNSRTLDVRGTYVLVNRGSEPIDTVHVGTNQIVDDESLRFDPPARRIVNDEELEHQIWELETPLAPQESVTFEFRSHFEPRGFRESGVDDFVVRNGTYLSDAMLPAIGYQRSRELQSPSARREQGLPERPVVPSLYDEDARRRRARGTVVETVIGTARGQIGVAPGGLVGEWVEGDRHYFHYRTEEPIGQDWAFSSAEYAVREAVWSRPGSSGDDVVIRVLHHPGHTGHVERTIDAIEKSLDYLSEQIGPYRYDHISVVEIPGDGVGVHADPAMLTHGEGFTLLKGGEAPGGLDMTFAVTAHEMGHQWNIPSAYVEGAPVMSEGVAWYEAMKVVEQSKGEAQLRRLLRSMRRPFPIRPMRRGEPLLRGVDPYMAYRVAPFALYALSETIGEDKVNGVLSELYLTHTPDDAPLATTLDLYDGLKRVTPRAHLDLLRDLFEVTTRWKLRTDRVSAVEMAGGEWEVTLEIDAEKIVMDESGAEKEVPMNDLIEIGVFAERERGEDILSNPLYLAKHRIRSGEQKIVVRVAERPWIAGVDPRHLLDWEEKEDDDNVDRVTIDGESRR